MIPEVNSGIHPADIQAALKKRGITQLKIANALGVSGTSITRVIHGRDVSRRIAEYISSAIGKPVDFIWPDKYN